MGMVYLLCGMAAAGKTTLAKQIAQETGAVRFTLDERMLRKYGLDIFDERYAPLVHEERKLVWQEALALLNEGGDVVFDWSLWNPELRRLWIGRVEAAGHDYKLYYLERTIAQIWARLEPRNRDETALAHQIPYEEVVRFAAFFQPPTADEGLTIEVVPFA